MVRAAQCPEDQIREGAGRLGLRLTPDQLHALELYTLEVLRWSGKVSLTALKSPDALVREGILDSLECARHVPPETQRVVDVGSGAGFPAIPSAIVLPAARFTLIESVRKKVTFLRHAVRSLDLGNAEVWHGRAESFQADAAHPRFDVAFARAASTLHTQAAWVQPLLRPGGLFLAQTSRRVARDELTLIDRSQYEICDRIAVPEYIAGVDREICVLRRA